MSAIGDMGAFFARETSAAAALVEPSISLPHMASAPEFTVTNGSVER
jgi:hypothetical protein